MRKITLLASCILLCAACSKPSAETYLDWLYDNMPLADSVGFSREYWMNNVERTLRTREEMGWNIPEREFRHFVLPLRANNETLDDFRTTYADTLCARVKGMSISEAALEINHWCHEQATYKPSDARTSSPMATVRNGVGRCGEESVLAVAALRAAGIPARQVYTPRWAHTDDNHAWVEVWADGKWHFMGACEPEPSLNMAWFNAPVSRAMLLHTNVFGRYNGQEDVIGRSPVNTEINVIRGYVPARVTRVKVVDEYGKAVKGACVAFTIYNYGEFYEVARYLTDKRGRASLNTGCGDMLVFASREGRFGFAVARGEGPTEVVLSHFEGERFAEDVNIVPPVENPIPSSASAEQIAENAKRLAQEDAIRDSHDHANHALMHFFASKGKRAQLLVSALSAKDRCDVSAEVLEDALLVDSDDPYVLSPRVEREALKPFRKEALGAVANAGDDDSLCELRRCFTAPSGIAPLLLASWTARNIRVDDTRSPRQLRISPIDVWHAQKANSRSRDIFYVALCRAFSLASRIDEVTGEVQYRAEDGEWHEVEFEADKDELLMGETGDVVIAYERTGAVPSAKYYRHFSISRWENGRAHLLEFGSDADDTPLEKMGTLVESTPERTAACLSLESGYYALTTGSRMADGSVLAHMEFFSVGEEEIQVPLVMRESETEVQVIGSFDADRFLPLTGRGYFILAVLGERDEPSIHARVDLAGMAGELNAWGRPVVFVGGSGAVGLSNSVPCTFEPGEVADMLAKGCDLQKWTLPVIAVCDSFGRIVYLSKGYNTSLPADLRRVISAL